MLLWPKLLHNNCPLRRLRRRPKELIPINPILHRPLPQHLKVPTHLVVVEVWLWHPMSLDPVERHHIHASRALERLRQHIQTMIDMCLVDVRAGRRALVLFVIVLVGDFAAQLVEAVQVVEHVHARDVCVSAVVEFERYFDGG
jgi:hypothetical protein